MTSTDHRSLNRGDGPAAGGRHDFDTANDRFKRSFGAWLWGSILAATGLHFAIIAFFPSLSVEDVGFVASEIEVVEVPPQIELPPPPEEIQRPAAPVVAQLDVDPEVTIEHTTFDHFDSALPPAPEDDGRYDLGDQPTFTPFELAPQMVNRQEVNEVLVSEYPQTYRNAGIGGTVVVHFFISERGVVENALVAESSGHRAFDDAALRVAEVARFNPAHNRNVAVPVWIQIPISFEPTA